LWNFFFWVKDVENKKFCKKWKDDKKRSQGLKRRRRRRRNGKKEEKSGTQKRRRQNGKKNLSTAGKEMDLSTKTIGSWWLHAQSLSKQSVLLATFSQYKMTTLLAVR